MYRSVALAAVLSCPLAFACGSESEVGRSSAPSTSHIVPTHPQGRDGGKLTVDHDGNGRYSHPVQVPIGRAGMAPELSLDYSSAAGDGLLGTGWRMGGLSQISRCGSSIALDGYRRGVQLDADDAFCLDGKRLLRVEGSYATDGAEYRTERATFSRVRSFNDPAIAGPARFRVERKDGRVYHYGLRHDARVIPHTGSLTGNTVSAWLLSRIEDRSGNYIEIEYEQIDPKPNRIAQVVPRRIWYTGYDGEGLHRDPTREILFHYEERPDVHHGYRWGFETYRSVRMRAIETRARGARVAEYQLRYENEGSTRRSRLVAIWHCVDAPRENGSTVDGLTCRTPTRFEWQTGRDERPWDRQTLGFPLESRIIPWGRKVTEYVEDAVPHREWGPTTTLDVNGDGADDLLYLDDGRIMLRAGHTNPDRALTDPVEMTVEVADGGDVHDFVATTVFEVVDYDGDGLDDLLFLDPEGVVTIYRSRGTSFEALAPGPKLPIWRTHFYRYSHAFQLQSSVRVADFTGDGRHDIMACVAAEACTFPHDDDIDSCKGTWHYAVRTPTGYSPLYDTEIEANCWGASQGHYAAQIGDFTGDGVTDLLSSTLGVDLRGIYQMISWEPVRGGFVATDTSVDPGHDVHRFQVLDVNGDGIHDLVGIRRHDEGDTYHVTRHAYFGTGTDFVGPTGVVEDEASWLAAKRTTLFWHVDGEVKDCDWYFPPVGCDRVWRDLRRPPLPLDVNGDGRGDLLVAAREPDRVKWHTEDDYVYGWDAGQVWVFESGGETFRPFPTVVPFHATEYHRDPSRSKGDFPDYYRRRHWKRIVLDADGDGALDVIEYDEIPSWVPDAKPELTYWRNTWATPEVITAVVDSIGSRSELSYASLANEWYYRPHTDCEWPTRCVTESRPVVSELRTDDGNGGFRRRQFQYEGGRHDLRGRGWLGFFRRYVYDVETGKRTVYHYDNETYDDTIDDYPFARRPAVIASYDSAHGADPRDSVRIVGSRTDYCREIRRLPEGNWFLATTCVEKQEFESQTSLEIDFEGAPFTGIYPTYWNQTFREYDDHGNVTLIDSRRQDGYRTITRRSYDDDESAWLLGRLARQTVRHRSSSCDRVETTELHYGPGTNLVETIDVEPGDPDLHLHTRLDRDRFGNVTKRESRDADGYTRAVTVEYDSEGLYPVRSENALGHETAYTYVDALGVPATVTDPNGLTTEQFYDGFGRLRRRDDPDGVSTRWSYYKNPIVGGMVTSRETEGGTHSRVETDSIGRIRNQVQRGPDGTVYVSRDYDDAGHLVRVSRPFYYGEAPGGEVVYEYDEVGRLRHRHGPRADEHWEYWYAPRRSFRKDPLGRVTHQQRDRGGHLARQTEPTPAGGTTRYAYCGDGQLAKLTDAHGNVTTVEYDARGRRVRLDDPNLGEQQFHYNSWGEVVVRRYGDDTEVRYERDRLGRLTRIEAPEGLTAFAYDGAPGAVGKMIQALSPDGILQEYEYDAYGRLASMTQGSRSIGYSYDGHGRVSTVTYPSVFTSDPFAIRHVYDAYGHLVELRRDSTGKALWTREETGPDGTVLRETLGNGVVTARTERPDSGQLTGIRSWDVRGRWRWDGSGIRWETYELELQDLGYSYYANGNLRMRRDNLNDRSERFFYDPVDRLTTVRADGVTVGRYRYDAIGNMTHASDLGSMTYGQTAADGSTRIPHALTGIGGTERTYDLRGNLIEDGSRTYAWTSFGKPDRITGPSGSVELEYDAFGRRAIKRSGAVTVSYVGHLYEIRGAYYSFVEKMRIFADGRPVAEVLRSPGPEEEIRYLHADNLGSIQTASDEHGNRIFSAAYAPFGGRQSLPWTDPDPGWKTSTGFGAHEHDDELGLINMGGRLYDPAVRRFTSADPFTNGQLAGQGLNRYSYTANNPLKWTDPSGYNIAPVEAQTVEGTDTRYVDIYTDDGAFIYIDSGENGANLDAPSAQQARDASGEGRPHEGSPAPALPSPVAVLTPDDIARTARRYQGSMYDPSDPETMNWLLEREYGPYFVWTPPEPAVPEPPAPQLSTPWTPYADQFGVPELSAPSEGVMLDPDPLHERFARESKFLAGNTIGGSVYGIARGTDLRTHEEAMTDGRAAQNLFEIATYSSRRAVRFRYQAGALPHLKPGSPAPNQLGGGRPPVSGPPPSNGSLLHVSDQQRGAMRSAGQEAPIIWLSSP